MKKLTIGLVIDTSIDLSDGVQQYVKTIGEWLSRQGHTVYYLTGTSNHSEIGAARVLSLSRSLNVRFNANRINMPLPASKKNIRDKLARIHFDVLHVQMPYAPWLAGSIIRSASKDTAIVGTFHILPAGWLHASASRLLAVVSHKTDRRFDIVMSVSKPAAEFAKKIFNLNSVVVPNAIDVKLFRPNSPIHTVPGRIVFLGRLVERKGALQLLKAFARLKTDHPKAQLVIAGSGPLLPALKRFVSEQAIERDVEFLGYVAEKNKSALLASAEIACFPALYGESFGIVLLEAMASGSQVVVGGNNPGYSSVFKERPDLLVDPTDITDFSHRLSQLLTDINRRESIHSWQQSHIRQFDVEVVGQQIVQQYYEAIAKHVKNIHTNYHEQ